MLDSKGFCAKRVPQLCFLRLGYALRFKSQLSSSAHESDCFLVVSFTLFLSDQHTFPLTNPFSVMLYVAFIASFSSSFGSTIFGCRLLLVGGDSFPRIFLEKCSAWIFDVHGIGLQLLCGLFCLSKLDLLLFGRLHCSVVFFYLMLLHRCLSFCLPKTDHASRPGVTRPFAINSLQLWTRWIDQKYLNHQLTSLLRSFLA